MPKIEKNVFQFKVTLRHSSPPIWRRVQIGEDATLAQFHRVLQAAMGWEDCHLHEFKIGHRRYGMPDDDFAILAQPKDDRDVRLNEVLPRVGERLEYWYDFGDNWRHDVVFEAILMTDPETAYPVCIAGERSCPPEDVGGIHGYFEYLVAMGDPRHEEHEAMMNWRGAFNPAAFSTEQVNALLRKWFRPRKTKAAAGN